MANKENFTKSINKDFSKENNYKEIMQKIEVEKMKSKNNNWRWLLAPVCFVIIIGGLLLINLKNNNNNLVITNVIDEANNIKLNINNVSKLGLARLDADVKEIPTNGINIPWPDILKDGITIPDDLDKSHAYAMYTRKDLNSEYDILNCYVYSYFNDSTDKDIRIAFSDNNKPIRDYYFSEEGSIDTIINDIELKIYQYEKIYFIEFKYKGYNFDIETNDITEQELISLLASIIK